MSDVPEKVDEILSELGIYVPSEASGEVMEIYERMLSGHCASCGRELGATTFITLGQPEGLERVMALMVFCGGACMTDMQITGWLQEVYDDIVDRVKFRGGGGGN